MGAFTPFKRHANQFKYTPRYYDPQKEALEQRRAELSGTRSDEEGYRPGQYIRTQSAARSTRRTELNSDGRMKMWIMLAVAGVVLFMGAMLYNKVVEVFVGDGTPTQAPIEEYEEFNPYTPITIVPNDYEEGDAE